MDFNCISPKQIILLASTIALEIACGKDSTEIAAIGDFFSTIGQNLSSISSQMEANELCNDRGQKPT
jgi:phage-related protein